MNYNQLNDLTNSKSRVTCLYFLKHTVEEISTVTSHFWETQMRLLQ